MPYYYRPHGVVWTYGEDYWKYYDPDGKEYSFVEFQKLLDERYPPRFTGDYTTASEGERKLLENGWRKEKQVVNLPPIEKVVGKYMHVSQFAEPRWYDGKKWVPILYQDLDAKWVQNASPVISESKSASWGHSSWLINADGSLTFAAADYDSSD